MVQKKSYLIAGWLFVRTQTAAKKVINQQVHNRTLKENKTKYSKYPPAFGIDLHIDDSPGVHLEGEQFNFRTIIIDENDLNWGDKILGGI